MKSLIYSGVARRVRFSLRTRMLVLLLLVIAATAGGGLAAYALIREVRVGGPIYVAIDARRHMLTELDGLRVKISELRAVLAELVWSPDGATSTELPQQVKDLEDEISGIMSELEREAGPGEIAIALEDNRRTWAGFREGVDGELLPAVSARKLAAARETASGALSRRYERFFREVSHVTELVGIDINEREDRARQLVERKTRVGMGLSGAILVGLLGIVLLLVRSLSHRVVALHAFTQPVAAGDLSHVEHASVGGSDELADLERSVAQMAAALAETLRRARTLTTGAARVAHEVVSSSAQVVAGASAQQVTVDRAAAAVRHADEATQAVAHIAEGLSATARDAHMAVSRINGAVRSTAQMASTFAGSASEAAAAVQQMTAAMQTLAHNTGTLSQSFDATTRTLVDMSRSLELVESGAHESAVLAETVSDQARAAGRDAAQAAMRGMDDIQTTVGGLADMLQRLGQRSGQIGRIVGVIGEVADRTHLLALNAAILASRAGEDGRAFSVVADEIKELARRTAGSAREIAKLIESVQADTEASVSLATEGLSSVRTGARLVGRVNDTLESIRHSAEQSTAKAMTMQEATASVVGNIAGASDRLGNMTHDLERIASAVSEQNRGADAVSRVVERVRTLADELERGTRDSSQSGQDVARAASTVAEQAQSLAKASASQRKTSAEIVGLIDSVGASAREAVHQAEHMDAGVQSLATEAASLQQELGRYRLPGGDEPPPS